MGDKPTDDDTSKLELPSLRLPRFGRGKRGEPAAAALEAPRDARSGPSPATRDVRPVEPAPAPARRAAGAHVQPAAPRVDDEPVAEPRRSRFRRPRLPAVSPRVAAALTGFVVGVFGALLTYASLRGCEVVKGTDSCGGAGVPVLVVILGLMVLLGGTMLAAWRVSEARGTSFLGVGLLCVIMLVTLIEELFSAWMFLVVPVLAAASYVVAHWVTTAFVEPRPERGPQHDIR